MVDIRTITPVVRTVARYGWTPPLPDPRYPPRRRFLRRGTSLPRHAETSTSPFMPPIWDQGNIGSCTGNGIARAFAYARAKQGCVPLWVPSRLFIYFNERVMEGTTGQDAGASVRDGVKSLLRVGVCSEDLWPYDIGRFADAPPSNCYGEARSHLGVKELSIMQTPDELRGCIAAGFPFIFGFTVWSSFEYPMVAQTGIMPVPDTDIEHTLGGHCVVACDYDDDRQAYKCANSWGTGWGQSGYFWFPYEIMHDSNYAEDFWQIDSVSG